MKNCSDLESGRVNLFNRNFTPSHGGDREELLRAVGDSEQ